MLTPDDKSQLTKQADELSNQIKALRKRLHELNDFKEKLFDQRNTVGKQISELIKNVKGIRSERDNLTSEVKMSKEEREKLNNDIKAKTLELKKLTEERNAANDKAGLKEDPRFLKRELERLNYKIETEAMSFDKETKLMKVIKDLKKKVDAAKGGMLLSDKVRNLSRQLDEMRFIAQSAHSKVQTAASASQEKHSGMMEVSHKIDDLKTQEDTLNQQITEKKAEMKPIGDELDAKSALLNEINDKLGVAREEGKKHKEESDKKKIFDKATEVRAKLMRGEKLTTEDILVLQGAEK